MHHNDNEESRFGSADWADEQDIARARLFQSRGLQVGYHGKRPLFMDTDAPILTIAGSGSGKMRDLLSMAIAQNAGQRNFILDPRGEISAVTLLNFALAGAYLHRWNPTGMHGATGDRLNPLDILNLSTPAFHADCKKISKSLIPAPEGSNGRYFELRASEWVENFMKMLVERDGAVTFASLYRVINAIESDRELWADTLEAMLGSSMDSVRRTAGEMLAKQQDAQKEFGSIVGEIYAHLNFLDDPMLASSLENPTASLADTCNPNRPVSWAINVPIEYVELWAPVLRTMSSVQMLYKSRSSSSPPVNMIIDEAGQLGRFEGLLNAFTYGRGHGIRTWALFQDTGQIIRNFGSTALQTFMGSSALRQFFGVRDYETARLISSMLGSQTLEYDDTMQQAHARRARTSAAMQVLNGGDPFAAANELRFQSFAETHRTKQARYLMTPDEILDMPEDRQILFTSGRNLKPIYAAKRHYDERREFAGRFLPHPFHAPSDAVLIPRMFGRRRARLIREPVPDKFAHFPQYRDGYWSYIEGYRPN
jgi:type IV secretion system protein VirD4